MVIGIIDSSCQVMIIHRDILGKAWDTYETYTCNVHRIGIMGNQTQLWGWFQASVSPLEKFSLYFLVQVIKEAPFECLLGLPFVSLASTQCQEFLDGSAHLPYYLLTLTLCIYHGPHACQGTFQMVLPPLLSWGIVSINESGIFPRRHPPQYCQSITSCIGTFFLSLFPSSHPDPLSYWPLTSSYYPDLSSSYCSNLSSFYYPYPSSLYHPDPLLELVHCTTQPNK